MDNNIANKIKKISRSSPENNAEKVESETEEIGYRHMSGAVV